MKMDKAALERYIKDCVREAVRDVLKEDKRLARALVKDAIVDMFGDKLLVASRTKTEQRQVRPPVNVPALTRKLQQRPQQRQALERRVNEGVDDGPVDLLDELAADTMVHTLPKQISGDRANPKSRSWSELATSELSSDDGPHMHLRRAAMTPSMNVQQRQRFVEHAEQQRIVEPSPSQVEAMYRQQQAQAGRHVAHAPTAVDDIAMLGLDGRWGDDDVALSGGS